MDYTAWRISFQSGDQAARSAFNELRLVKGLLAESRQELAALRAMIDAAPVVVANEFMADNPLGDLAGSRVLLLPANLKKTRPR